MLQFENDFPYAIKKEGLFKEVPWVWLFTYRIVSGPSIAFEEARLLQQDAHWLRKKVVISGRFEDAMRVRLFFGLLLLGSLGSCHWFETQEKRKQSLVEEEIAGIDWNQVDQFPLFDSCDEAASRFKQQDCFESTLLTHVSAALEGLNFQAENELRDTLYVDFKIDNQGRIEVLSVGEHPLVDQENPDFKALITRSLKTLPGLQPAIKRGVPVAARFRIPLVLQTDE